MRGFEEHHHQKTHLQAKLVVDNVQVTDRIHIALHVDDVVIIECT